MAEKESRAKAVMSGGKKKSKKKSKSKGGKHHVHKMHIRHAANGGYIVEHEALPSTDGSPQGPNPEHALPDMESLQAHVGENMQPPQQQEEPQPQPQPQPQAAM